MLTILNILIISVEAILESFDINVSKYIEPGIQN